MFYIQRKIESKNQANWMYICHKIYKLIRNEHKKKKDCEYNSAVVIFERRNISHSVRLPSRLKHFSPLREGKEIVEADFKDRRLLDKLFVLYHPV